MGRQGEAHRRMASSRVELYEAENVHGAGNGGENLGGEMLTTDLDHSPWGVRHDPSTALSLYCTQPHVASAPNVRRGPGRAVWPAQGDVLT